MRSTRSLELGTGLFELAPEERLQFKPGITGLAQVENGYDEGLESVQRKVELDHRYMRSFSLSNDLKILWRSVAVVFTGRGAF